MTGFWRGRSVLITGHTGFKGSWLAHWLLSRGAEVHGLALAPDTSPALFDQLGLAARLDHALGDIRNEAVVRRRVAEVQPDVVFHLAAQPLVRRSYREPVATFATNVMGTAHLLDAVRELAREVALVVVTTDKVYENDEREHAYRETDRLGGHDPYSASKAACELVAESYRKSFFGDGRVRLATARAGNVIGGGDWAEDRLIPDLVRAAISGTPLVVRNPDAVRPWQHVLDPLAGYIRLAEKLAQGAPGATDAFNFGPGATEQHRVREVLEVATGHWPCSWQETSDPGAPHEAGQLTLATEKVKATLGWAPRWSFEHAVRHTIAWYRAVQEGADPVAVTTGQIEAFEGASAS